MKTSGCYTVAIAFGRGKILGILGPVLLYGGFWLGVQRVASEVAASDDVRRIGMLFLVIGLAHLAVAFTYWLFQRSTEHNAGQSRQEGL